MAPTGRARRLAKQGKRIGSVPKEQRQRQVEAERVRHDDKRPNKPANVKTPLVPAPDETIQRAVTQIGVLIALRDHFTQGAPLPDESPLLSRRTWRYVRSPESAEEMEVWARSFRRTFELLEQWVDDDVEVKTAEDCRHVLQAAARTAKAIENRLLDLESPSLA